MSEHMFFFSTSKLSRRAVRQMERIAKRHGADFIEANIPGTGRQSWFAAKNLGDGANQNRAEAVRADLEAARLWK